MSRSDKSRTSTLRRGLKTAGLTALGLVLLGALSLPGCSKEEAKCEGVEIGGECQQKCDVAKCADPANMKCVQNACFKMCTELKDCPVGYYCMDGIADDKQPGKFCAVAPFAEKDGGTGMYEPCAADAECDTQRGYSCVDSECRLIGCTTHADCAEIGLCTSGKDATGKTVLACKKDTTYPKGQFGSSCPGVASADGGTTGDGGPNAECDQDNGFTCLGAGPGDVDAYCTKTGCQADTDCATGYFCATVRTSRAPCSANCGLAASQATTCVPSADIGAGKEFSCGPVSLLRNICLKRDYCNECTSDDDCRALPGHVCAKDTKGNKKCTVVCDPNIQNACPWGNASICDVHDSELGKPTCAHKFGDCKGTGKGCEPCIDDLDCPGGLCLTSDFSGEHYCVDLAVKCTCFKCTADADCPNGKCKGLCGGVAPACTTDAECGTQTCVKGNGYCEGVILNQDATCAVLPTGFDSKCPKTPGGLTMTCYGGYAIQSTSVVKDTCVGANVNPNPQATPQTGCWPAS